MAPVHSGPLRWMVLNAVIMALGLTLPMVFHAVGLGSRFLPMLLPLLLNGFLSPLGWLDHHCMTRSLLEKKRWPPMSMRLPL